MLCAFIVGTRSVAVLVAVHYWHESSEIQKCLKSVQSNTDVHVFRCLSEFAGTRRLRSQVHDEVSSLTVVFEPFDALNQMSFNVFESKVPYRWPSYGRIPVPILVCSTTERASALTTTLRHPCPIRRLARTRSGNASRRPKI